MRHLDLFSGIGGFALAAWWVGWETVGFCEIEPYCRQVLRKHWPDVPIYEDVKDVTAERLKSDGIECDILTGGFPCQDISYAGKGAGIDGKRSGLWSELARIIGEVRPRYAVLENVAALLNRGLERVTGDLAEIGYDCEWHCIPASAVGAPHRRDRIWIIAYPNSDGCLNESKGQGGSSRTPLSTAKSPGEQRCLGVRGFHRKTESIEIRGEIEQSRTHNDLADAISDRLQGQCDGKIIGESQEYDSGRSFTRTSDEISDTDWTSTSRFREHGWQSKVGQQEILAQRRRSKKWWAVEPDVGRVADGIAKRMDRLRGLGNAIVPQIAEAIFRAIDND